MCICVCVRRWPRNGRLIESNNNWQMGLIFVNNAEPLRSTNEYIKYLSNNLWFEPFGRSERRRREKMTDACEMLQTTKDPLIALCKYIFISFRLKPIQAASGALWAGWEILLFSNTKSGSFFFGFFYCNSYGCQFAYWPFANLFWKTLSFVIVNNHVFFLFGDKFAVI